MTKSYVKKHKGHKVPVGAAHYNIDNHLFYNKDKTAFRSPTILGAQWKAVSNIEIANASIELPEQDEVFEIIHAEHDLPNWDDQPKEGDVWIEFNQDGFSAGWYRREGDIYISRGGFVDVDVDCAEHELIVHKRPIAKTDTPNWDDAPEWADRLVCWMEGVNFFSDSSWFINNDGRKVLHGGEIAGESDNWWCDYKDCELIEMRPIAIEDKEWLPTNGEWCQHKYEGKYEDVFIVGLSKGNYFVYQNSKSDCYYTDEADYFRPLKTAEELERDRVEKLLLSLKPDLMPEDTEKYFQIYIEDLLDNGFTAPKGEG